MISLADRELLKPAIRNSWASKVPVLARFRAQGLQSAAQEIELVQQ